MLDTNTYPVRLFRSEDDGGFIAEAVDLPGCSAFGETMEAACHELQDAIRAWIEAAEEVGNVVPAPSTTDVASGFSDRIAMRCSKSLHAALSVQARHEGVSLNSYIVSGLTDHVAGFSARWSASSKKSSEAVAFVPARGLAKA